LQASPAPAPCLPPSIASDYPCAPTLSPQKIAGADWLTFAGMQKKDSQSRNEGFNY